MSEEKQIQKIMSKAEVVSNEDVDLEESDFINVGIQDFISIDSKVYFNKDTDELYKFLNNEWYRYKKVVENIQQSKQNPQIEERLDQLQQWFKTFYDQQNKNTQVMSERIQQMRGEIASFKAEIEMAMEELQKYVDLKVKGGKKKISK